MAADRDRRPLLLRLAELVSSPRGNPTGEQASRLARRVAHNLQAAGWRLERVLSDNGGEYGAQALAYSWARQGLPIAAYAEKIRDIRAQTGRMIS